MSSLVIKAIKTLPKITIKKPQITIKDLVTTKPPSQVSGTEILASNNRAMLGRNVQTSPSFNIKRGYSNPYCEKYFDLCNSSNFTIEEAKLLTKTFHYDTGLILHCPGNDVRDFHKALSSISDAVKSQTFPKEIKHVMIGHGSGRAETEWITAGRGKPINILEYINSNKDIKAGDMVLVTCCETGGILNPLRPGKGLPVDLSLTTLIPDSIGGPAKIVIAGQNKVGGHFTIPVSGNPATGLKLY